MQQKTSHGEAAPWLSISIVSHKQSGLVQALLQDISRHCRLDGIEILLTLNLPEAAPAALDGYPCPVTVICNPSPLGFGANHNQAFLAAQGRYFCVLNPDVRLSEDALGRLADILDSDPSSGLVAPQIIGADGAVQDSARYFPSVWEILGKVLGGSSAIYPDGGDAVFFPDWVAGIFMMLPAKVYQQLGGFDTHYYLYYEDVDLCARLRLAGYRIALCREVSVVHDARKTSHWNLRYMRYHLTSMLRFFLSPVYRRMHRGQAG